MREIKFRCWDENQKVIVPVETIYHNGIEVRNKEGKGWFIEKDFVLMQFTGLLDKNGKEIYEGDIVKGREGLLIGDVKFGQYKDKAQHKHDNTLWHIGWYVQGKDRIFSLEELEWYIKPDNYSPFRGKYLEVIGNVFENSSLLSKEL